MGTGGNVCIAADRVLVFQADKEYTGLVLIAFGVVAFLTANFAPILFFRPEHTFFRCCHRIYCRIQHVSHRQTALIYAPVYQLDFESLLFLSKTLATADPRSLQYFHEYLKLRTGSARQDLGEQ